MSTDIRLKRLNDSLLEKELDAYLATRTSDIRWLTGFSGVFDEEVAHALLVASSRLVADPLRLLHTDMRYAGAMKAQSSGVLDVLDGERKAHSLFVVEQLKAIGVTPAGGGGVAQTGEPLKIGIEADLPLSSYRALVKALDEAEIGAYELVEIAALVEQLRALKDAVEIETMRTAQQITDAGFAHMLEFIKPGLTEFEVAVELEFFMRKNGSKGLAFGVIVGSGPNSANPHAIPGDRVIEQGDLIVLDFGAKLDDYRTDMTRTVAVGKASERQREIYNTVLEAQLAVLEMMKPGVPLVDPFNKVNEIFAAHGFDALSHGLGHGVGIDIHESPTMGLNAVGELAPGQILTVEPGIYIEGHGGVRIEDFGVVTADGFDNFTASPKQLIEL